MKFIHITMSDHSVWQIPASVIAENRARYFAERDPDTTYEEELEYTLSDDAELLDWVSGNYNWEDLEADAMMIKSPHIDYSDDWQDSYKEVVEC
jgi:hypothetical protein